MLGADTSTCFETKFVQETKSVSESPPSVLEANGLTPTEKRLRTLKKKLQQIESIKEKREKGEVLETTQVSCSSPVHQMFPYKVDYGKTNFRLYTSDY